MAGLSVQQPATPPAPPEPLPTAHYVGFLDDVGGLEPVSFEHEPLGEFLVTGSTPLTSPRDVVLSHRGTAFVIYNYSYENLRGIAEIDPVSQTVPRTMALPAWENSRWTYTNTLALSPDQNFLVVGTLSAAGFAEDDQRVFVIDVDTFDVVSEFTGFRSVAQVTFSRDGLRLFVADNRGWSGSRIVEIDMVSRREVRSWVIPVDGYTGHFAVGPDEDRFFLYSESSNMIGVLHMATREFDGLVDLPFTVRFATVDPTNRLLWIVDHTNSKVWKFDLATATVAGSVSIPYGANHLAVSRTGSYVFAVSYYSGMLTVLNATDLSVEQSLKVAVGASNVAHDPVGGQLFVSDNDGDSLVALQVEREEIGNVVIVGQTPLFSPRASVFSPDGKHLFATHTAEAENTQLRAVTDIDIARNTVVRTINLEPGARWTYTSTLAISPDGLWLAAGTASAAGGAEPEQHVFLIDATTFEVTADLPLFQSVTTLAFSPTGDRLFVGDNRGWSGSRIAEVDIATRQITRAWPMPDGFTGAFTLSPHDPDRIVLFSEGTNKLGTLQLSTGQLHLIANLPFTVRHAMVHPDGDRLVIADHTASKVWIYDLRTEQVVAVASVSYGANQLALTPRGQFILVVSYYTGELTVLQTNDLSVLQVIKVGTTAAALAFDAIGENLFVSDNGGHNGLRFFRDCARKK